jgi:hypothetical protein
LKPPPCFISQPLPQADMPGASTHRYITRAAKLTSTDIVIPAIGQFNERGSTGGSG